ncbi:hypothetical protein CLV72_105235 [Allonocardiopsis opalescens]|uniref:Uncharacterized protein n=1 Tax=Allonocardiopsis opalescens TaxID=1144618 RepID=A0A2T0Q262_9ACTN|nr:hypothetical protein CLV72_105235 [Allonocardiopsis opalescens]
MKAVLIVVLGLAFGAVSSLSNAVSSPYNDLGAPLTGTLWASAALVVSLVLNAGWAWAGLAVVAGRLTGALGRGAAAGMSALLAASVAYYASDAVLRPEPFGLFDQGRPWLAVSLVLGPGLGAVGALAARSGWVGLLAGLTVPVGAVTETVLLPRGNGVLAAAPLMAGIQICVVAAAVAAAALLSARFAATRRRTA